MTDEATRVQNSAADPRHSTWLSASAGSGKTRVLTDRVARLLLRGTRPQDILCLTYTKAAATEMQNRLFRTLGRWAMMPDADLRTALAMIGEDRIDGLDRARTLFARAIETPGGLRIQTIHSFCAGLMRQFPIEAGVTPEFREMDADQANELLAHAVRQMAETGAPELLNFLECHDGDAISVVCSLIASARISFQQLPTPDVLSRKIGIAADDDMDRVDQSLLALVDEAWWTALKGTLVGTNATNERITAAMPDSASSLSRGDIAWIDQAFAHKTNDNSKAGKWPSKPLRASLASHIDQIDLFLDGVIDHRIARRNVACRDNTIRLHRFAQALLPRYDALKQARGMLDFDDLIQKTSALLRDETRAWVRYRLDNRIEHILVDEAQDTSPEQWDVISALADEIVAGDGAGPADRSLFVVGDRKQSIYSFQGADATAFDAMQNRFAEQMADRASPLSLHQLEHSFRSSTAILSVTDAVLDGLSDAISTDNRHKAFFADLPGRVDLWPVVESGDTLDDPPWHDPVDRPLEEASQIRLADKIAYEIARLIREEAIPTPDGGRRNVTPGDILVLVQRRGVMFQRIIRTAQSLGVDIAGPDRLRLVEEVAVKDILAVLRFLSLPEDDLSLAEALRSPLFGFDEAQLFNLAHDRQKKRLWHELSRRRDEFSVAHDLLADLLRQADFLRPYEIVERLLVRHEGRARLLARLGSDAEDAIDEFLSITLEFEQSEIPDLTSFLGYIETLEPDIKRSVESSGRKVRVMSVHGAKGLEAPIVILPDTIRVTRPDTSPIFFDEDGAPYLKASAGDAPEIQKNALNRRAVSERAEAERLLYVAMTRAETWLIVCGAAGKRAGGFWHKAIEAGFAALASVSEIDTPVGPGRRLAHGDWPSRSEEIDVRLTAPLEIPAQLDPLEDAKHAESPLNPSDLGGAKVVSGATHRENARDWGAAIHLLLEHLPTVPVEDRALIAAHLLSNSGLGEVVDPLDAAKTALGIIDRHPDLFCESALREVALAGRLGDVPVAGTIDLMLIDADNVRIVDFKTNAAVPSSPDDVPESIIRQMGAYYHAARTALPHLEPLLEILWTETGELMRLPHGIVSEAFRTTTTS